MEKKFYTEPESMIVLLDTDDTIKTEGTDPVRTSWVDPKVTSTAWQTGDLTAPYILTNGGLPVEGTSPDVASLAGFNGEETNLGENSPFGEGGW